MNQIEFLQAIILGLTFVLVAGLFKYKQQMGQLMQIIEQILAVLKQTSEFNNEVVVALKLNDKFSNNIMKILGEDIRLSGPAKKEEQEQ